MSFSQNLKAEPIAILPLLVISAAIIVPHIQKEQSGTQDAREYIPRLEENGEFVSQRRPFERASVTFRNGRTVRALIHQVKFTVIGRTPSLKEAPIQAMKTRDIHFGAADWQPDKNTYVVSLEPPEELPTGQDLRLRFSIADPEPIGWGFLGDVTVVYDDGKEQTFEKVTAHTVVDDASTVPHNGRRFQFVE